MTSLENAITGNVIVYQAENESVSTNVLFKDETFWMTQKDISKLFDVNPQAISKHLNNIYSDGELDKLGTCSKMEQVQIEGSRSVKRVIDFYNLDAIIAVGYRVNSKKATQFRIWATGVLREYIIKGFALDDNMLKNGRTFGQDYFKELLRRIRSIRASERREIFTMKAFIESVDKFLDFNEYQILTNKGLISMTQAQKKAISEYEVFNTQQKVISDFDKFVKEHS
ncbi:MAG: virulence RhuM family protein [Veillonella sp.]|uniref:virulence RhuM family protein n=1 Tax=Veillonella sp. TaxID=1926307 RepID=UPI0025E4E2BB|nr:RhuM family protein [Veillonella sp.]MBS5337342.1 virulence RhuM family protein [Veillonella sp.]